MNDNINLILGNEIIRITKARVDIKKEVLFKLKSNFQTSFLNQSKFFLEEAWNYVLGLEDPEILIGFDSILKLYNSDNNKKSTSTTTSASLKQENEIFNKLNTIVETLSKHQKTLQQIRFLKTQQQHQQHQQQQTVQQSTSLNKPIVVDDTPSDSEKWIKDLLFSIVELKKYYLDYISTIIKYYSLNQIHEISEMVVDEKATISSESFQRPFYRINKSIALKILNLNDSTLQPIDNTGKTFINELICDNLLSTNNNISINNSTNNISANNHGSTNTSTVNSTTSTPLNSSVSSNFTPISITPNNISPLSTPSFQVTTPTTPTPTTNNTQPQTTNNTPTYLSFWKNTKSIYFKSTSLSEFGQDIMINKLYQLLNIPCTPTLLLVIYLNNINNNGANNGVSSSNQPYYIQSFWGIDNCKKFDLSSLKMIDESNNLVNKNDQNNYLDINLISFAEQILGTLLVAPKENKFLMVQTEEITGSGSTSTSCSNSFLTPLSVGSTGVVNGTNGSSGSPQHGGSVITSSLPPLPPHSMLSSLPCPPPLPPQLVQTTTLSLLTPHPLKSSISIQQQNQKQQLQILKCKTLISIASSTFNFQSDSEIKQTTDQSEKNIDLNLFFNSTLMKLPQMDKTIPIRFQKFISNINPQFLIIQWLSKLEEFNQNYQNLINIIKYSTSNGFSGSGNGNSLPSTPKLPNKINSGAIEVASTFTSTSSLSSLLSSTSAASLSSCLLNASTNNNEDYFYLKFNLPIKLNRKIIEIVQKRFELIQYQLKKNNASTFSDLFVSVFPSQFSNFQQFVLNKKIVTIPPKITITFSPDSTINSSPTSSSPINHIKSSSFSYNPNYNGNNNGSGGIGIGINNFYIPPSILSNNYGNSGGGVSNGSRDQLNSSSNSGGGMTKSHSSSFSLMPKSTSMNLNEFVLPSQLLSMIEIDRFKLAENVFQSMLVNFHLDSKKLPLNVIYSKLCLLISLKATHFTQSRSIKELYRLISRHLKNQNQITMFNQKFKPIFKQISNENPHLQLDWVLLIEEWFPDEWENPKQLFPRNTREIKGAFFGKRLLPTAIHQHLFTANDGQFIKRNGKYGKKDVSWFPEQDPIWYFKKYPEIPGYEYAASELMRSFGIKNIPHSELVLFYDPNLKKSYPVLLTCSINGKLLSDIWNNNLTIPQSISQPTTTSITPTTTSITPTTTSISSSSNTKSTITNNEINENLLDKHNTGLLIISTMLLSVEDGKSDNFIISDNGKYLTPIDNDRCFVSPGYVLCEKQSFIYSKLMEQKKKLVTRSLLFNLSMMKEKIVDSIRDQILTMDCFEFLTEWCEKLMYVHDRYSTLLPEEELSSLYHLNSCILRIHFTSQMIQNLYNSLLTIQNYFKYSELSTTTNLNYFDLSLKLMDPFIVKQYQSSFGNDHGGSIKSTLSERYRSMTFHNNGINYTLKQIVQMLSISNQELYGEAVRVKNEPSTALIHLKKFIQSKIETNNKNQKLLSTSGNGGDISPINSASNLSTLIVQTNKLFDDGGNSGGCRSTSTMVEMNNAIDCLGFTKKHIQQVEKKFKNEFGNSDCYSIINCTLSDSFIKKLTFSNIQFLDLRNSEKLTKLSLGHLLKVTPKLVYLNISGWKSLKKISFTTNVNYEFGLIDLNQLIALEDDSLPPIKLQKLIVNDCQNLEFIDLSLSFPCLQVLEAYRNIKLDKIRINYNLKLNTDLNMASVLKRKLNYLVLGDKNVGKSSIIKIFKFKNNNNNGNGNSSGNQTNGKSSFSSSSSNHMCNPNFYESNFENSFPNSILKIIESKLKSNCFCEFGIILVYDCSNESSFYACRNWLINFKKAVDPNNYIKIILIGNKSDSIIQKIKDNDINSFSKEYNIKSFKKSSIKLNLNDEFNEISNHLIEKCSIDCGKFNK